MIEFIVFGDAQFQLNHSKSYMRSDGLTSWFHAQLQVLHQIFKYSIDNNIKYVIHNGDLFERKTNINIKVYNKVWELFNNYSKNMSIILNTGNHDFFSVNRDSSLVPFSRICTVITSPTYVDKCGMFIPYGMIEGNLSLPKSDTPKLLFTHEDISGLKYGPLNYQSSTRLKPQIFGDWDMVFNGHIHRPQKLGNVINIGSPMIQDWGEAGDKKRFIHYKDGEIESIPIEYPQFYILDGITSRIRKVIIEDNYNFYRIDIDSSQIGDPIFKKFNCFPNIIKTRKRKLRFTVKSKSVEDELREYLNIIDSNKLDKARLLKIGCELVR